MMFHKTPDKYINIARAISSLNIHPSPFTAILQWMLLARIQRAAKLGDTEAQQFVALCELTVTEARQSVFDPRPEDARIEPVGPPQWEKSNFAPSKPLRLNNGLGLVFWTTEVINTSVAVAVWGRLINANFDFRSSSVFEFEKLFDTFSKFISVKSGHSLLSWILTGVRKLLGPPGQSIE